MCVCVCVCVQLSEVFDSMIDDAMQSLGFCCGRRVSRVLYM